MGEFEKRKNTQALLWTIGVHAAVLGACALLGFAAPPPLPNQDLGMVVNLGTSQEGSGERQPLIPNPPSFSSRTPAHTEAAPASNKTGSQPEDIATQNRQDAPVIPHIRLKRPPKVQPRNLNIPKRSPVPRPIKALVEPKPVPRKPKAIMSAGMSRSHNSGNNSDQSILTRGEGLTAQMGDQGASNGDPNASNHNGLNSGLGGSGLSYRLTGRNMVERPGPDGQFNEPGRVRLSISVDQQGNVTGFRILSADNATIAALAARKVKQIRFNSDPNAPVIQFGDVVMVFKLHE